MLAKADSNGSAGENAGDEGGEAGIAAAADDHKDDVSAIALETNMVGTRLRSILVVRHGSGNQPSTPK